MIDSGPAHRLISIGISHPREKCQSVRYPQIPAEGMLSKKEKACG